MSSLDPSTRLRARSGPLDVEILTGFVSGPEGQRSVIAITGLADLSLWDEGVRPSASLSLGGLEIHVGDPLFDDALFVRGSEPLVRALLDAETRRLVLLLFEGRVEVLDEDTTRALESVVSVRAGMLRVEAVNVIASPKWLGECLLGLLDVARRLARPADIAGRLAANVHDDPLSAVRLANLRVLLARYAGRPVTRRALRSALVDPDRDLRLRAATEVGEEGRPVLLRIDRTHAARDSSIITAVVIPVGGEGCCVPLAFPRRAGPYCPVRRSEAAWIPDTSSRTGGPK